MKKIVKSCIVTTKCCGVAKGVMHPFQNATIVGYDTNLPIMFSINYEICCILKNKSNIRYQIFDDCNQIFKKYNTC